MSSPYLLSTERVQSIQVNVSVLIFQILFMIYMINPLIIGPQIIILYLLLVIFLFAKEVKQNPQYFLFFFFLFGVINTFNIAKGFSASVLNSSLLLLFSFIIVQIFSTKRIDAKYQIVIFSLFFLYVISKVISGANLYKDLLAGKTYNIAGFYMMSFVILYYAISYMKEGVGSISIIPALANIVIAFFLTGRSTIVSSCLLLFYILYVKYAHLLSQRRIIQIVGVSVFFVCIIYYYWGELIGFVDEGLVKFRNADTLQNAGSRTIIWQAYLNEVFKSPLYFLAGAPNNENVVLRTVDGNLHNSFFSMHFYLGMFSLLILSLVVNRMFFTSNKVFIKILFLILLIRAFSDSVFFVGLNDYIFYSLLFMIKPLVKIK